MTAGISQVAGQFLEYPGSLERFEEPDTNDMVPAVPRPSNPVNVSLVALTGADMLEDIQVYFTVRGALNAFTGTLTQSPWFPYNIVQTLRLPYQSGSLVMGSMDGGLWAFTQWLRGNNQEYQANEYIQQKEVIATAYSPASNLVSSPTYAQPVASATVQYDFNFHVFPAMYFERFYDLSQDGKMLRFDQTYVSPFLMSSTGRNVIPVITLNPLFGTSGDLAPFVAAGAQTTPATWTDSGSQVRFKRRGWRQPVNAALMPPLFNWAHQWFVQRNNLGTSRVSIPIPVEGQCLCVALRMWDNGLHAPIPLETLNNLKITYGSGLNKFYDRPQDHQDRFLRQHNMRLTSGFACWDMYCDTRTNLHGINTYNTASPVITLDFGSFMPPAGSYVDVMIEFLTLIGN